MGSNGAGDFFDSSESDDEDTAQTLADQIVDKYVESKFDAGEEKKFMPEGTIEGLITLDAIIKELFEKDQSKPAGLDSEEQATLKDPTMQEIIQFILTKAKKVFAISLVSGICGKQLGKAMKKFKDIEVMDSSLPIVEVQKQRVFKAKWWSKVRIQHFCHEQWKFLVPVFTPQNFKVDLQEGHILPFIEKSNSVKGGAFGQVFQVRIHPAHQRIQMESNTNIDDSQVEFAIKEFIISGNEEIDEILQKDAEDVWEKEVATLNEISGLSHPNLIQRIAAITRGKQRCLMFLWADGGNLRDFWSKDPSPTVTAALVKDIIAQLRGMAEALQKLHEYRGQLHYRHGDIKPENILCFPDHGHSQTGTLVISDLGSAQHHLVATRLRERTGGKAFATKMYEAPESMTNKLSASSRLYDIWSMGCVTLEFMVWLLYGYEELTKFNASIKGNLETPSSFFVLKEEGNTSRPVAYIHPAVKDYLALLSNDPECTGDTALAELLDIIKTKLLVIELPARTESSSRVSVENTDAKFTKNQPFGKHRSNAAGFVNALDDILQNEKATDDKYWFTGQSRNNLRQLRITPIPEIVTEDGGSSLLSPGWKPQSGPMFDRIKMQDRVHLSDDWLYPVDNDFARRALRDMKASDILPSGPASSRLCGKCKDMDFWTSRFRIEDTWSELDESRGICDFCRMRWDIAENLDQTEHTSLSFERVDSMLKLNDKKIPALSICRSPELDIKVPIQIGFPQLPDAQSESYFTIVRQWLHNCDKNHQRFRCQPPETSFLPTRLIDVGQEKSDNVRLYETQPKNSVKYIALSHPWGKKTPYFQTFRKNVEEFKKGIKVEDLTPTFKDAVKVTRELNIQYLWIDSICIIQRDESDDGDFAQEAKHMENVFSSAYCVLAASSAKGQYDGFLNEREGSRRDFVTFERPGEPPFYVCRFIDDFNEHVLKGHLNTRGWVMQERVLAHRTVYFTDKQTYWQCGEGVRCETLTKMDNKLESFLADPNFPEKVTSNMTNRGERIIFYEDLYKQYSRLAFTRWEDRPIAIAGLERRLISDLKAKGGFGVFDDRESFLPRSLMWRRSKDETSMRKITFPPERNITVPTWSWMAYEGAIDFLELPLGGVDWPKDNIYSPWTPNISGGSATRYPPTNQTGALSGIELSATARNFNVQDAAANEVVIIYDIPEDPSQPLKCVVMGTRKAEGKPVKIEDARHYVLFIAPKADAAGVYERVGVGYMPGKYIDLSTFGPTRLIKVR